MEHCEMRLGLRRVLLCQMQRWQPSYDYPHKKDSNFAPRASVRALAQGQQLPASPGDCSHQPRLGRNRPFRREVSAPQPRTFRGATPLFPEIHWQETASANAASPGNHVAELRLRFPENVRDSVKRKSSTD